MSYDDSTVETLLLEMTSSTFEIQRQLESVATLQDAALISFWERARKPSTKPPSLFVHLSKLFFSICATLLCAIPGSSRKWQRWRSRFSIPLSTFAF
nr:hypothetical protein [Pseudomonas sp. BIGb0427]